MGYLVEQYRKKDSELLQKLHEAKMLICEIMEELEDNEEPEMEERRSYRLKKNYRGRYDY